MSARLLPLSVVLVLCAGCWGVPSGNEGDEKQRTAEVLEAYLRNTMGDFLATPDGPQLRFYFALYDKDPPGELLGGMKTLPAAILPASQCPRWVPGVDTKDVVLRVDSVKWQGTERVQLCVFDSVHWGEVPKCGTCSKTVYVWYDGKWVRDPYQ